MKTTTNTVTSKVFEAQKLVDSFYSMTTVERAAIGKSLKARITRAQNTLRNEYLSAQVIVKNTGVMATA